MNANEDSTIEPKAEADGAAPAEPPVSRGPGSCAFEPAACGTCLRAIGTGGGGRAGRGAEADDRASIRPVSRCCPGRKAPSQPTSAAGAEAGAAAGGSIRSAWPPSIAAVGFVSVSLFAGYDHLRQHALIAARTQDNQELVKSFAAIKTRIDAIESARSQEQTAELHKTLAEIKPRRASAQGANAAMTQLAQRVDKLEKDQSAAVSTNSATSSNRRASNRYAEIVARLEKLEKKPATVAVAQPTPPQPAPSAVVQPTPSPRRLAVSNETTGSIEKPKPLLRGYALDDVRGNVAFLESRDGPFTVSPGDVLPGAGRVLKIERHGPNWVVVTSQGVIASPDDAY